MHQPGEREEDSGHHPHQHMELEDWRDMLHQGDIRLQHQHGTEPGRDGFPIVKAPGDIGECADGPRKDGEEQDEVEDLIHAAGIHRHAVAAGKAAFHQPQEAAEEQHGGRQASGQADHMVHMLIGACRFRDELRHQDADAVAAKGHQETDVEDRASPGYP